jgi:hypothetical protein
MKNPSDSFEFIARVADASNRYTSEPVYSTTTIDDVLDTLPITVIHDVEQLIELLPFSYDGQLEVRWGHDDERAWPRLPTSAYTYEEYVSEGWRISRTDDAVYIQPIPDEGAGPVMLWFSPYIDPSEPQAHGYVDQD